MRSAEASANGRPVTLSALISRGVRRFRAARLSFGHGTTSAFDEAAYLALHALELPPDDLHSHYNTTLSKEQVRRVGALYARRIRERIPAAYLTREAWLGDFRFYVDERAIVPRSYIAELVRDRLAPWLMRPEGVKTALDLCTGSGCLAILLAKFFPGSRVDAVDICADALHVARRNVADYRLKSRVSLVRSDLFGGISRKRYDLIVSNPPYVRSAVMRKLPVEYRREPALALAGGKDGLDVVRGIMAHAAAHLNPGGMLVVEAGHNRNRVEKAYPDIEFTWPLTSGGDDCVFVLERQQLSPPGQAAGTDSASP